MLRGGRWGYDRLRTLARARRADTLELFGRAGIRPGLRCLDLGCGGGEVSFELARLTGPDGSVTGVDMDEVKLALAREAAGKQGLASADDVATALADLAAFAADPRTVIASPRTFQLWARKPAA